MASRILFVDELYCKDRLVGIRWNGFLDATSVSTNMNPDSIDRYQA